MKNTIKIYLSPLQFEGEGGAAGAEGSASASQQAAVAQQAAGTGTQDGTTQAACDDGKGSQESPRKTLKELLKEDPSLRKEYDDGVSSIVQKRLKNQEALNQRLNGYQQMFGLMKEAFPDAPDSDDPQEMQKYLEGKSELWANAAAEAGMSVDTYKEMKRIERENQKLLGEQRAQIEEQQKQKMYQKWDIESEALKQVYPDFDIRQELMNPDTGERFSSLLGMGWTMQQVYEAIHANELIKKASVASANNAAQSTARMIQQGSGRPLENGASKPAGKVSNFDPSTLTDDEIVAINKRVASGETITF